MLNLRQLFLNRRGFSLIEFILVIGISSMIFLIIFSLYEINSKAMVYADERDEVYLYGKYIVDYIGYEVRNSDLIIRADKIKELNTKYPNNVGFLAMIDRGENYAANGHDYRYVFFTYHLKGNTLERIAYNTNNSKYPTATQLRGYNGIYDKVLSIKESKLNFDSKLLELSVTLGTDNNSKTYKSAIYLFNKLDF
jgi:prepilin-type N-terminal cleavage/methylation domain-containing protein